jgi:hypothetical protein
MTRPTHPVMLNFSTRLSNDAQCSATPMWPSLSAIRPSLRPTHLLPLRGRVCVICTSETVLKLEEYSLMAASALVMRMRRIQLLTAASYSMAL